MLGLVVPLRAIFIPLLCASKSGNYILDADGALYGIASCLATCMDLLQCG